ncbi:Zn(2)-C6 fungal-specific transcription factor [Phycomyces blakesleeanus]
MSASSGFASNQSSNTAQSPKPIQRKKKATRACIHCQKAHLTCNDSRPCQRCIKRDLASTCTDGARKKAKYLQDAQEPTPHLPPPPQQPVPPLQQLPQLQQVPHPHPQVQMQPQQQPRPQSQPQFTAWPQQGSTISDESDIKTVPTSNNAGLDAQSDISSTANTVATPNNIQQSMPFQIPPTPSDTAQFQKHLVNQQSLDTTGYFGHGKKRTTNVTPEMIYTNIQKPFSYADGYHYLISYVRQRMSREDLMRISRALALFRPSVLASMMNLTEHDLIFTERCLQRTLLEYEKLISYSGTPTVVWRRTGEITLVGKEFSLLTQWSRDALLSKKTFIYELMSNPSAVEYWEKYALHAFDNTDSAVYSSCILLGPTKRAIPCTFCFTIKRDIFDLPSVIIGNVSHWIFKICQ